MRMGDCKYCIFLTHDPDVGWKCTVVDKPIEDVDECPDAKE